MQPALRAHPTLPSSSLIDLGLSRGSGAILGQNTAAMTADPPREFLCLQGRWGAVIKVRGLGELPGLVGA